MEEFLILPKSLLPNPDHQEVSTNKLPHRTVLITGMTGQDGLYLTAFLLFKQQKYQYQIHGIVRKNSASLPIIYQLMELLEKHDRKQKGSRSITLHYGDMTDSLFVYQTLQKVKPDEIYNLAAQTHVQHSFYMSNHTLDVNLNGLLNICQSVVQLSLGGQVKIFHASTSEMFGQIDLSVIVSTQDIVMDENFPFNPASPYAVSKISAYYLLKYYRNVYKLQICTAFSFNHESPLRHDQFITRKITKGVARIKLGIQDRIKIGNLYAQRDWGHALDFVRAFWMMLNTEPVDKQNDTQSITDFEANVISHNRDIQSTVLQDYVVATETSITVKEFMFKAFREAGFTNIEFQGQGLNEKLVDKGNNDRILAEIDPQFLRPGEVPYLKGTYKKIQANLNWEPEISIDQIIKEMIDYDIRIAEIELNLRKYSHKL